MLLAVFMLGVTSILFPQVAASQPLSSSTPSAECSAAAAATELGAAARQRFLGSCEAQTRLDTDLDPGGLPSESSQESKLSPPEKARLEYCLGVASGRSLSGASRQRFLHDCLSP